MSAPHPTPAQTPFLAWPSGGSLLYLISAACLLGGAGLALAPGGGHEERLVERLAMTGIVALYTSALLGVACLVCHWRRDHEDSIALSVLLALFLVAAGAPLDVLALERPGLVAGLGVLLTAGTCSIARIWSRRVGSPLPRTLATSGACLLLGAIGAPVTIGLVTYAVGRVDSELLRIWWQLPTALVTGGLLGLWLALSRTPSASPWPRPAALRHPGFPWVLALIVGAAACAQVWLISYTASLGLGWADILVPVVALLLALDALLLRSTALSSRTLVCCWLIPTGIVAWLQGAGSTDPWHVPLAHPALAAALGAAGQAWRAWRTRDLSRAMLAVVWASCATSGWGAWEDRPEFHGLAAGSVLFAGLAGLTLIARHPHLAVTTVIVGTLGLASQAHPALGTLLLALGIQLLVLHLVFRERLPDIILLVGALATTIGCSGLLPGVIDGGWSAAGIAGAAALPSVLRERERFPALLPLGLPILGQLVAAIRAQPAWAAVALAFLLLGIGALVSRRQRGPSAATGEHPVAGRQLDPHEA